MNQAQPKHPRLRLAPELYEELRNQVLRRDGWRCQACGTTSNLEVHHKELSLAEHGVILFWSSSTRFLCSLYLTGWAEEMILSSSQEHSGQWHRIPGRPIRAAAASSSPT